MECGPQPCTAEEGSQAWAQGAVGAGMQGRVPGASPAPQLMTLEVWVREHCGVTVFGSQPACSGRYELDLLSLWALVNPFPRQ